MDYFNLISRGKIYGSSVVELLGHNEDIDTGTTPEDIWMAGGSYPWLAAATQFEILSGSGNDTSGGTGARTFTFVGLNSSYAVVSETVTLNGVTPVATVGSYLRLNLGYVATAGSSGSNEGNLTIRVISAGATHGYITPGHGKTLRAFYTVPAGYTAYVYDVIASLRRSTGTDTCELSLKTRDNTVANSAWLTRMLFSVGGQDSMVYQPQIPFAITEKTDFRFVCDYVSASNTIVSVAIHFGLISNSSIL